MRIFLAIIAAAFAFNWLQHLYANSQPTHKQDVLLGQLEQIQVPGARSWLNNGPVPTPAPNSSTVAVLQGIVDKMNYYAANPQVAQQYAVKAGQVLRHAQLVPAPAASTAP